MRALGVISLAVGALMLLGALVMDVSVPSGLGRVNNIGLMAERQNYIIIGGILLIAGLIVFTLGRRQPAQGQSELDTHPCPMCAEAIKKAAVKCKHCGADVQPTSETPLLEGWVALIPCQDGAEQARAVESIKALGLPVAKMQGANAGAGPFFTKEDAKRASRQLSDDHKLFASVEYLKYQGEESPANSLGANNPAGWTIQIPLNGSTLESVINAIHDVDAPLLKVGVSSVTAGPFDSEASAKKKVLLLEQAHSLAATMHFA